MINLDNKKLKILVLGDSHGTEYWKRFDFEKYNKIIF